MIHQEINLFIIAHALTKIIVPRTSTMRFSLILLPLYRHQLGGTNSLMSLPKDMGNVMHEMYAIYISRTHWACCIGVGDS